MHIAPGYTDNDWKQLDLDDDTSSGWATGIEILQARIKGRYLDPADLLVAEDEKIRPAKDRRFGFTILAIDCLLIETLQAFIEGKRDTKNQSGRMFRNFLTTHPAFSLYFNDQSADRFYRDFRCGILHHAEVPPDSVVWSVGPLLRIDGKRMVINRTKFHEALKIEFESYLTDLADSRNRVLRSNFRRKMNYICQV